ncbi:hypothetical protein [Planosporangium mesophilum]|uniref:hypothetical protein n=1 Tax=Planosporangium mesophilum TaxID=689768 RepID=UPI00143AC638|nr:hypothetical protein [Planosporangium mesophilum]NJC85516.1 hypothetical protein [Planosporangium mesophilum]
MSLFRRRRLPADRRPPLGPEERIVAWATAAGDEVVVLTNHGIWLPGVQARLGWHEIHKATWSGRQLALVASREVLSASDYAVMEDEPATVHTLLEPGDVPAQVRSRVTKSIAYTQHHPVSGGGVWVVARRVPGVDGLRWTVRYDSGVDRGSEEVRSATADLVEYGRSSVESGPP